MRPLGMNAKWLAVGVLALGASLSFGVDTATLTFTGTSGGDSVSLGIGAFSGGFAGVLNWKLTNINGGSQPDVIPYYTICGDLYDNVAQSPWQVSMFDTGSYVPNSNGVTSADWFGTSNGQYRYIAADSVQVAGRMVGAVGANNGNTLGTLSNVDAAALQGIVWYALYVGTPTTLSVANLTAFSFSLDPAVKNQMVNYWNLYYTSQYTSIFLRGNGPHRGGDGQQDQFGLNPPGHTLITPEPFTMSLGLASAALFIRRKVRRSKAA